MIKKISLKKFLGLVVIYILFFSNNIFAEKLLFKDTLCFCPNLWLGKDKKQTAFRKFQLQKIKFAGIKYLRVGFNWSNIEKEKGRFNFDYYDKLVDEILSYDLKIIALLAYGNIWASKISQQKKDIMYPPDNVQDFGNYVFKTVQHYKNKINYFEIWNEQNAGFRFWKTSFMGDAKKYGELLKVAYLSAKKANNKALISFGGTFYAPQFILGTIEFTKEVFKNHSDIANYFDTYSFHPYMLYPPSVPPESTKKDISGQQQSLKQMINNTQKVLQDINANNKPLWITENGWPLFNLVSELQQAQYLVRSYIIAFTEGVSINCWYTFADSIGHEVKTENLFGLFSIADSSSENPEKYFKEKLSYKALRTMNKVLGNFYFSKNLKKDYNLSNEQYLYEFKTKNNNIKILVFWSINESNEDLKLTINNKTKVTLISMLGDKQDNLKLKKQKIKFSQSPQYLLLQNNNK